MIEAHGLTKNFGELTAVEDLSLEVEEGEVLGVIGSSRARDAKSAQNVAVVIILPVLALIAVQVTGLVWFTPILTLALALGIGIVDIIVLRVAVRLFQRESIVVKWH